MDAKVSMGLVAFGLWAIALSACGGDRGGNVAQVEARAGNADFDLPGQYGLYALEDGRLGRLDGEKSFQVETWESRSNLKPDVRFVVFDRAVVDRSVRLGDAVVLRRVAHVRNEVAASGAATPLQKDVWVVADLSQFAVPVDFQPIHGAPEMVKVVPKQPLPPGLYSLQLQLPNSAVAGRFGVQWTKIDKGQYAAANCVDRYAGAPPVYRPCGGPLAQRPGQQILQQPLTQPGIQQPSPPALQPGTQPLPHTFQQQLVQPYRTPPPVAGAPEEPPAPQPQASPPLQAEPDLTQPAPQQPTPPQPATQPPPAPIASAQGLKLRDVKAVRTVDQGVAILTVEGLVVNATNELRRVPPMLATVRDTKGVELDRWTFAAENPDLPPGGSTGFRTETIYPTTQSTNVVVTFASDSTAQAP